MHGNIRPICLQIAYKLPTSCLQGSARHEDLRHRRPRIPCSSYGRSHRRVRLSEGKGASFSVGYRGTEPAGACHSRRSQDFRVRKPPGRRNDAKKRGQGLTRPGPLYPLLALPLAAVDEEALKGWYDREAKAGKHQAARAWMMFKGFLRWCAVQAEYRALVDRDAVQAVAITAVLPQSVRRTDALEAAQLPGWFAGADALGNKTIATYLKALVLTGARREEMATLKWADVDFQWQKLTLADKVHRTRTLPLTPYLAHLLAALPRLNQYVFASGGKSGHIVEPRAAHANVQLHAGVTGLTVHGLRRSFSLLGEAAGAPAGAIAQVMGHSPSGVAEGCSMAGSPSPGMLFQSE